MTTTGPPSHIAPKPRRAGLRRLLPMMFLVLLVSAAPALWSIARDWLSLVTAPDSVVRKSRSSIIGRRLATEVQLHDEYRAQGRGTVMEAQVLAPACQRVVKGSIVDAPPFVSPADGSLSTAIRGAATRDALSGIVVSETNQVENILLSLGETNVILLSACMTSSPLGGVCRDVYRTSVSERGRSLPEMMEELGLYRHVRPGRSFGSYCSTAPDLQMDVTE